MEDMLEGIITLDNYIMTLERVLKLENFYFDNYAYVREEIDANNRAVDLLFDYYKKYHIYDKRMVNELKKCMKLVNDYRINSANNHNVIIDGVKKDIPLEYYSLYKSSEYVKKEPEFIKYYPLLKLVYNDDGSLYSIKELFVKRRSMLNDGINISELNKIYEHILVSYQVFMDMDSILNEIKIYLDSVNHDDVFALFMLEVITDPKVIITKEEVDDKIQKRILKFRGRNKS